MLKGAGPRGYPGMPEVGNLPLPKKLLAQGITDMVRISDGRMSGTAFGTVVLHVAPEAAAAARWRWSRPATGSRSTSPGRRLELDVDDGDARRPPRRLDAPAARFDRGYGALFLEHVLQADQRRRFRFPGRRQRHADPQRAVLGVWGLGVGGWG